MNWTSKMAESTDAIAQIIAEQPPPNPTPIKGFPCDPRIPGRTVIVMVDIAKPIDPTISPQIKLQAIKNYVSLITLPEETVWNTFEMGLGVFHGSNAYILNNWLCKNQTCWNDAVDALFINETSQSHNTTRAYNEIWKQYEAYSRSYASLSAVVVTEKLWDSDKENASAKKEFLNSKGVFLFGIGLSMDLTQFENANLTWDDYILVDGNSLVPGSKPAITTTNFIRDSACANFPGRGNSATPPPFKPTQAILHQKDPLPPQTWPDICIVLDTSADFSATGSALNDEGFEVVSLQ
ncbi:unnamed protein product, partial [Mesorhabditis belari]|uniref:Uncharacterized protein n=1 Tax=Mesorhabditis belari TaxID=2138241 RepID=A0AAF3FKU3_9BILA